MKSEKDKAIKIDVTKIPPEVGERIGRVFLEYHKRFRQNPKLMAELEALRAARNGNAQPKE